MPGPVKLTDAGVTQILIFMCCPTLQQAQVQECLQRAWHMLAIAATHQGAVHSCFSRLAWRSALVVLQAGSASMCHAHHTQN
jgi:hypothetical protein